MVPKRRILIFAAVAAGLPAAFAQQQPPPTFVRDLCVKVRDGKSEDYQKYLGDVPVKLAEVRVKAGRIQWWGVEQAVTPAGEAARCDYHLLSAYEGFPPEPLTPAEVASDYERAKIPGTPADSNQRRDADSRLINVDLWRVFGTAGGDIKQGAYVRRNFYRLKPGHTGAEWAKLETTGWMPFAQQLGKETPGLGWAAIALAMPGGERLPYEGGTVDIFPDWKSLGASSQIAKTWPKVHPEMAWADYASLVNSTVERRSIEVYRIRHYVQK